MPLEELELDELELLELEELLEEELLLDELALLELEEELELELLLEEVLLVLAVLLLDVLPVEPVLLLDELELLELDSSPWVTNKPSPPQALSAANTRHSVSERRDFVAVVRKPEEDMKNTPHKCVIRVHVKQPGAEI